jgi:rhodanese-related sulfurtransferase
MNVQMSPTELASKLESLEPPMLLDVREPEEHEFAALKNSKLIPLGQIAHRAGEISDWKDKEVVVYCHHGIRSLHAIAQLRTMGFQNLRNLSGGIDAWSATVDGSVRRY